MNLSKSATSLSHEALLQEYTDALLENNLANQERVLEAALLTADISIVDALWEAHMEVGETLLQEDKAAYTVASVRRTESGENLPDVTAQVRKILSHDQQIVLENRAEAVQWARQQDEQNKYDEGTEALAASLEDAPQTEPLTLALVAKRAEHDKTASLPRVQRSLLQKAIRTIERSPEARKPIHDPPSLREMREMLQRINVSTADWIVTRFQQVTYGLLLSRREETIQLAAARRVQTIYDPQHSLRPPVREGHEGEEDGKGVQ